MDASFEEVVNEVLLAKETAGKFAWPTVSQVAQYSSCKRWASSPPSRKPCL